MSLEELPVPPSSTPIDDGTAAFLKDAGARIDAFFEARWQDPIVGFVPSDFEKVWPVLAALVERELAPGRLFCEWGGGFCVVAGLAAKLGFRAHAIEIEPDLVAQAARLLSDHRLDVKIGCGSFIPRGGEDLAVTHAEMAWLITEGPDGHAAVGRDPQEWDVVFAYPWPGEEHVIEDLFERYAAPDARLVTYANDRRMRVRRKLDSRSRRRGR